VFQVYLPVAAEGAVETSSGEIRSIPRGKETILLVEDDTMTCQLTAELLSSLGYSVTAACSGEEALQKCSAHEGSIDLLMTDVVMPGMSGKMVADAVRKTCPSIKVIFISGYSADKLTDHGVHGPSITLIEKPVMLEQLAITVRNVLDGRDIHEQKD
jgi:CheY-like chemotaxis protein